jgi:hypothetical protein
MREVEMRRTVFCLLVLMAVAPAAMGQAVTGFTGGNQYNVYYTGTTGDTIGFRFEVTAPLEVAMLGVWNEDTAAGGAGLTTPHQVGIWDASQALVTSATVDPATGTVIGGWIYAAVTPVTLSPGQVYTAGVLYTEIDNDSYISSATSMSVDPSVLFIQSVYPTATSLGFAYPAGTSGSFGRFGPNFTFTVVPVELQSFTIE